SGGLGPLDDAAKGFRVVHREVGEHLPVQRDVRLAEAGDEAGVRGPVEARGRVDSGDPELAELPLTLAAVPVLVLEALLDGVLRNGVDVLATAPVAFRHPEDLAAAAT